MHGFPRLWIPEIGLRNYFMTFGTALLRFRRGARTNSDLIAKRTRDFPVARQKGTTRIKTSEWYRNGRTTWTPVKKDRGSYRRERGAPESRMSNIIGIVGFLWAQSGREEEVLAKEEEEEKQRAVEKVNDCLRGGVD